MIRRFELRSAVRLAGPLGLLIALFLGSATRPEAAPLGDYRHDYLLPDEREGPIQLYGYIGGSWIFERHREGDTKWRADFTDRASSGAWAAGTIGGVLSYFVEGGYYYEREEAFLGQARADLRVWGNALNLRAGRFLFPFGIEARMASERANPFILRPFPRSGPWEGAGLYGHLWGGAVNYSAAAVADFPSLLADTIFASPRATKKDAVGGRLGLSPRPGLEIGASYAEEEGAFPSLIRGADFSARTGPVFLVAEWARLRREEGGTSREADMAYGRIGYAILELTSHFDAVELLAGADLLDPDKGREGDRTLDYLGGIAVRPRGWISLQAEYHLVDRQEDQADRILTEVIFSW